MGRLDGKVALISGTARGMGRAAALEFAAEGAAVFGCDLDADGSAETVELVTTAGGQMAALAPVNLSSAEGARHWVDAAAGRFGGVDILYNNASALRSGPLMELSDEDWHFTIKNELDIVWYSVRAAHRLRRWAHGLRPALAWRVRAGRACLRPLLSLYVLPPSL
jgi:meso-butanediol dehydrogenase / (S,S)-butanediol dehydrogenase / diacetyl reductase